MATHLLFGMLWVIGFSVGKCKAVNDRDKNFTDTKLKKRMEQLEECIGRYLAELDRAKREPAAVTEGRSPGSSSTGESIVPR